jgi:hypothetical protein
MTDREVATLAIAMVGAVTGVLGLVLSILNFRRDRAFIRVRVSSAYLGGDGEDDFDGPYIFVGAVNEGRRVVTLRSCGLLLADGQRIWMKPGPVGAPNTLSGPLGESDERQLWVHIDALVGELRLKDGVDIPTHGWVDDTTGRRWLASISDEIRNDLEKRVTRAQSRMRRRPAS